MPKMEYSGYMLLLEDPRKFSDSYPQSNILISQALDDLHNANDNRLMVELIRDLLKRGEDEFLSVAYNLAPTKKSADYIWDALQIAINHDKVKFFAIPLVLIIGSNAQVKLKAAINQDKLHQLLAAKGMLMADSNCYISGNLYTLDAIARFKPSFLYTSIIDYQHEPYAWSGFSHPLAGIENLGENVHLRFLIGIGAAANKPVRQEADMEIMQLIVDELKTDGATIFPIPFPVCDLSEAVAIGERYRKEIHISLRLSNQLRKLRESAKIPYVRLLTVGETIKVELWEPAATKPAEILNWNLQRNEDFRLVSSILEGLFIDMQLEVTYA